MNHLIITSKVVTHTEISDINILLSLVSSSDPSNNPFTSLCRFYSDFQFSLLLFINYSLLFINLMFNMYIKLTTLQLI